MINFSDLKDTHTGKLTKRYDILNELFSKSDAKSEDKETCEKILKDLKDIHSKYITTYEKILGLKDIAEEEESGIDLGSEDDDETENEDDYYDNTDEESGSEEDGNVVEEEESSEESDCVEVKYDSKKRKQISDSESTEKSSENDNVVTNKRKKLKKKKITKFKKQ